MGGQAPSNPVDQAKKSMVNPLNGPIGAYNDYTRDPNGGNPFGGGNVAANIGADYQTAVDNPVGHVWTDTPYGGAAGAAASAAQGYSPTTGSPVGAMGGKSDPANQPVSFGGGALPTLGSIAAGPSPFGSWVNPDGSLKSNATYNPHAIGDGGFDGNLGDATLSPQNIGVNTTALKGLQSYAIGPDGQISTSASPWLNMQNANVDLATGQARNQASLDAQSASDQAISNAAMHGGITGGGAARISALGTQAAATGEQNATLAGNVQKNQNAATDWTNKLGIASALPGMQQSLASYNAGIAGANVNAGNNAGMFNTGNAIGGVQANNSNLLQQYMQAIMGQGGSEMATAMANAGGKKKG